VVLTAMAFKMLRYLNSERVPRDFT
jgi:hypothetical protein